MKDHGIKLKMVSVRESNVFVRSESSYNLDSSACALV